MSYTSETIYMAQRAYNVAVEQRKRDIRMPHPLTGSDIEEPWYYFERMYRGYHYDFVKKMASWASMPVANKVFAGIEAYTTMLCDSKPAITIVPREPSDEKMANIAKAAMGHWWDSAGMENTVSVTVKASRIFGLGWFHTYFDKKADNEICETVHPSHVLVDPDCVAGNFDPTYLIYEYKAQYGALKERYDGKVLPDGSKVDFTLFSRNKDWRIEAYNPDRTDDRMRDPVKPETSVHVYEFWYKDPAKTIWEDEDESGLVVEKSKKSYPRGRVITIAGGIILDDKENPHLHGEFPFTPVFAYIVPGRFYPIGDCQQVMNNNIMRNRFTQLIIDMTMKSGGGWMFLGAGSKLKPSMISQGPFNVVQCGDVNQIRIDRPPGPSRAMFDFIQVLDMDFDDAMGIHEISRGATLTSHKTAQEIAVMAESDRTRVRQAARNLIWSLKRVARQVMWDLAQYHQGDWFVRIAGDPNDLTPMEGAEDGMVETRYEDFDFNGKMFLDSDGESLKFDIVFADDATLPNSQSETFSKIQGLLEMGVIMPEDILKYKLVDIPYAEQILLDRQKAIEEEKAAQTEQAAMPPEAAMPPPAEAMPMGGQGAPIPPELLAMLGGGGGGMMPAPAPGPMGDPMTDMLMGGTPQMPQGMNPEMMAQLVGGAAVPTAPPPGVDPLAGLGEMPAPQGGIDQSLIGGMIPPVENLTPEQIEEIAAALAEKFGLPIQLIMELIFEILGTEPAQAETDFEDDLLEMEPETVDTDAL